MTDACVALLRVLRGQEPGRSPVRAPRAATASLPRTSREYGGARPEPRASPSGSNGCALARTDATHTATRRTVTGAAGSQAGAPCEPLGQQRLHSPAPLTSMAEPGRSPVRTHRAATAAPRVNSATCRFHARRSHPPISGARPERTRGRGCHLVTDDRAHTMPLGDARIAVGHGAQPEVRTT